MNTKPFYQLTTKNGIPTFYLFFDNMDLNDRLIIKVMIYRCNIKEYNRVYKEIKEYHGDKSIEPRENIEYMKYVIIHHNDDISIIDMDTLRKVHIPENKSMHKSLISFKVIQDALLDIQKIQNTLKFGPSFHHGDKSNSTAKLIYKTQKHGKITLNFSRYLDPNLRNGFSCNIQKNINKESMYGALIYATNPRFLICKKAHTIPKIPTKTEYNKILHGQNYWEVNQELKKKYMGKENNDKLMMAKGKQQTEPMSNYNV